MLVDFTVCCVNLQSVRLHLLASCRAGPRQALQLFVAVYRQHPALAVEALSWVLTPDADQGIEARVEAAEGTVLPSLDLDGLGGSEPDNAIQASRPVMAQHGI